LSEITGLAVKWSAHWIGNHGLIWYSSVLAVLTQKVTNSAAMIKC